MKKHDLLIVIPAYNESGSIENVLEQLDCPEISSIADILVINDASSDNTTQLVRRHPHILVTHVFNLGYGSAIRLGYKYAVRRQYDYVIQMDADGQHDPCNIPVIYQTLQTVGEDGRLPDIVLGSRFLPGSSSFKVSAAKKIAIRWFRWMIKCITGATVMDPTSGLQGLSRKAFLYYSMLGHFDDRYPDANMVTQMLLLEFKIMEIPAIMHSRENGSSMHSGLKPVAYMFRMTFSILAVMIRCKYRKIDAGVGKDESRIWKK